MKPFRLLAPLVALAGASLGLSACNVGLSDAAAQVGSTTISRSELNATLAAMTSNAGFACVITGGNTVKTTGAGESYTSAFAAQILTTYVEDAALRAKLADAHLALTSYARSIGHAQLLTALQPGQSTDQSCTTPAATVLAQLPSSVRAHLVDLQAEQDLLSADRAHVALTAAGVGAWARAHRSAATISCVSLVPFSTSSEAGAFVSALHHGSSFATAAQALGTQTQSGCLQVSALPANLATAINALAVGATSAPVSYSGNYLVFQVTSRHVATGSQAAELLLQTAAPNVSGLVSAALAGAAVSVSPAYGHWAKVAGTYQVVPPTGPAAGLLFNPGAVGVAATSSASSGLPVGG